MGWPCAAVASGFTVSMSQCSGFPVSQCPGVPMSLCPCVLVSPVFWCLCVLVSLCPGVPVSPCPCATVMQVTDDVIILQPLEQGRRLAHPGSHLACQHVEVPDTIITTFSFVDMF